MTETATVNAGFPATEANGFENGYENGADAVIVDVDATELKQRAIDEDSDSNAADQEKKGCFKRPKKPKPDVPPVPVYKLFKFSTGFEKLLILIGIVSGIAHGALLPGFTIIFGDVLQSFGGSTTGADPSQINAQEVIDIIVEKSLIFIWLGIAAFVTGVAQVYFLMWTGQRQARRMRNLYMRALLSQEMAWYDEVDSAELAQRVSADVSKIEDGIGDKVSTALQFTAMFVAGFIIGFIYSWKLTLVIFAITPLLAASGALFAKMSADAVSEGQTAYAKAGAVAEESFSMIRIVAAFNLEETETVRYIKALGASMTAGVKKQLFMGAGLGITMFVIFCSYALAFWYGNKLVKDGELSQGRVVTVFFSVIIGAMGIGQGAPAFNAITEAAGSAPKVFDVIARRSQIDAFSREGKVVDSIVGRLTLRNVNFTYRSRQDRLVLDNLNLDIEPGTTVALVGESGCGKSTTIQLLERFYDPIEGSVQLDGVDLSEYNVQWLRGQMGFVQQMPVLFAKTIRENIELGAGLDVVENANGSREFIKKAVTEEEIIAAAKLANAHDFIMKLPERYDTLLGERGAQLSGGQKQRIAIARALVRNPRILLLDEATSALDTTSERIVQEAIEKAQKGRTVVVIAHRLSTIRNADKIAVFEAGVVKELGTHEELISIENGIYTNLVRLQMVSSRQDQGAEAIKKQQSTHHTTQKSAGDTTHHSAKDESALAKADGEKSIDKGVFARALKLNRTEWPYFIGGLLGAAVSGVTWPIFALIFSEIIVALFSTDPAEVRKWALIFVAVGIIAFFSNFAQLGFMGITGEKLTNRLRIMSFKSIIRQDIGFFDLRDNSVGILTSRLASEASKIRGLTGERLGNFLMIGSTLISAVIIAFVACWRLAFVVLATVPAFAIGGAIQMKMMAGFSGELAKLFASANSIAITSVDCIQTVTALGIGERFIKDYNAELEVPAKAGRSKALVNGLAFGFTEFCMFAIWALAFWYGSKIVPRGQCDFNGVLKALTALLFGAMTLGQVAALMPDAADAAVAATKIFRTLDRKSKIDPYDEDGEMMVMLRLLTPADNMFSLQFTQGIYLICT